MYSLKGRRYFYEHDVSDIVEYNLKHRLSYGLLELGAYTVAAYSLPTSGFTNLKRSFDNRYGGAGRVYEGVGPEWVWETDVTPVSGAQTPILIASGVTVNGTFYPTASTTGTYAHKINFRDGIVLFNSSIPSSAEVKCEYTFRHVGVHESESREYKKIYQKYQELYNELADLQPSGMAQTLKQNRVLLPAVVVEVTNRTSTGFQLGGGEIDIYTVEYHIFSDKGFSNKRLCDVISNQFETTVDLFDLNDVQYPYNIDGTVASGAVSYKVLGDRGNANFWTYARITDSDGGPLPGDTDIYRGEITHTVEVERRNHTYDY